MIGFLLIIGILLLAYPKFSNWLANKNSLETIKVYENKVNTYSKEYIDENMKKARDYQNNLVGNPVQDPFVPGSGAALPENYLAVLDEDGVMGYINIPKIKVELPIYHGVSEEVLRKGVGHIEGTALPIGGEGTHSVLSGHTGLPEAELFTDLIEMEVGDMFYIEVLGSEFSYQVDHIDVIEPTDISKVRAIKGEDYITLVTCTPYGINSHRLLVRGTRVYSVSKDITIIKQNKIIYLIILILSSVIVFAIFLHFLLAGKRKKKEKEENNSALNEPQKIEIEIDTGQEDVGKIAEVAEIKAEKSAEQIDEIKQADEVKSIEETKQTDEVKPIGETKQADEVKSETAEIKAEKSAEQIEEVVEEPETYMQALIRKQNQRRNK
jgi:sortase A